MYSGSETLEETDDEADVLRRQIVEFKESSSDVFVEY